MVKYEGSKKGGVAAYQILDDAIILEFKDGRTYRYNYLRPGKRHVEEMKKLAVGGSGLTTYVNQHVRDNYYSQLHVTNNPS